MKLIDLFFPLEKLVQLSFLIRVLTVRFVKVFSVEVSERPWHLIGKEGNEKILSHYMYYAFDGGKWLYAKLLSSAWLQRFRALIALS